MVTWYDILDRYDAAAGLRRSGGGLAQEESFPSEPGLSSEDFDAPAGARGAELRVSGAGGIRTPGPRERPAAFKAAAINRTLPPLQAGTPPVGSPTGARAGTLFIRYSQPSAARIYSQSYAPRGTRLTTNPRELEWIWHEFERQMPHRTSNYGSTAGGGTR